ncbi:hypothetical protein TCAL_00015 [Tigriopus californicus]|uniref:Ubiquitin carboxyl-terminal hydrolase n=1 Tax=Tigriopus californicus TaxID=6832 RepID=A0A553PFB3_TIGCA|nr:ubiquitin carboxyl-terminal hydrolase 30 homolog [Tigriopus californicus]TRY76361.1 hypothetical protein TCAL_00015 [Tigriopus californicus]|eukprot:TCALIF_00015-PA protein Name:"Similar to usp30 Ubiquitin carboxyl-terminal hydrolase 30 (Xenopus tropicalis)" AED:0.03 eAED:0.03 QI:121/1/1/1/1/1/2/121/446
MDHPPWPLFALAGAAALALGTCYVAFGPSTASKRPRRPHDPPGLSNSGQSCFVNAILQALASCGTFIQWLETRIQDHCPQDQSVREQLGHTLAILNNRGQIGRVQVWSAEPLMTAIRMHGWVIDTQEQDAHEMLHILLTSLEEELLRLEMARTNTAGIGDIVEATLPESNPVSQPDFQPGHRRRSSGVFLKSGEEITLPHVEGQTNTLKRRKTSTPFNGTLTNKVTFTDGRSKSPVSSLGFNNITLCLPKSGHILNGVVSLETLLQMYISRETVEGATSQSGHKTNPALAKQLAFGKLPPCLCLHIQRTAFSANTPSKRWEHVAFPELLDMKRYVYLSQMKKDQALKKSVSNQEVMSLLSDMSSSSSPSDLYLLRSVVVHLGQVSSGHYVTYRRGPLNTPSGSKWFCISDASVEPVPLSTVLKANAFMLFYEKLQPTAITPTTYFC